MGRTITISPSPASRAWRARCGRRWRSIRAPRTRCRQPRARSAGEPLTVITGLVPVIPLRDALCPPKRDGRDKPGHDKLEIERRSCVENSNAYLHRAPAAAAPGRSSKRSGTLRVRARRIPFLGLRAGAVLAAAVPAVAGVRYLSGGQHPARHRSRRDRRVVDGAIPRRVADRVVDRLRGGDVPAREIDAARLEDARLRGWRGY